MELCLLFLLSAGCWQISSADYFVDSSIGILSKFHGILKCMDNLSLKCASGELTNISTICYPVQSCGNGLCQCCRDAQNIIYADCSGHGLKGEELSSIPPLPPGVQVLKFSSNGLHSEHISPTFFDNVTDLTHLYLSNNFLTYIKRNMFEKLTKLKCLNVNGNYWLRQNSESLGELLSIPEVEEVSVLESYFPSDFVNVSEATRNTSVTNVFVSSDPSSDAAKYNMSELSTFQLSSFVAFGNNFRHVNNHIPVDIERLVLCFDALFEFPVTCSVNGTSLLPVLKELRLPFNFISDLSRQFVKGFCLPTLTRFDLSFNLISTLPFNIFSRKHLPNLQYLSIMRQNYLNLIFRPMRIEAKALSNPSLEELHLEHNDIWFGHQDLVAADAFDNCTNLTSFYLDGNSLRDVDDDRFLELFGGLRSLRQFSLSDCQFEAVSPRTFQTLTRLTHLYLDGNLISFIPHKTFEPLQYLKLLDLSNNKLAFLSDQAFRQGFQYNLQLSLRRNPFVCSCELIWLREYGIESGPFVVATHDDFSKTYKNDSAANYKCQNLKGFSVANFSLARQACLLSEQTSVLITYTCSLLIVALTAFLLLFAYRWHFRLLLYEAFRGNGQARRLRLQQNKFNYDVFVSYASEDLPWVRRHLMPQLEDRLGLRLCIHERDFIIGNNIVDNIAECVESSKKILMVFSKSFVLSQWCQFELTYCLSHVLKYDDALIIVCVDDVVSHEMTSAMMAVLKTTTYIQWMEEEYATESFWGRIKIALQEIMDVGEHAV